MDIAVIDYGGGNIFSVVHALKRLGANPILTDKAEIIQKADKVVFPGQGEASSSMQNLRQKGLDEVIRNLRQPILGICIGQQLMCSHSEEGDVDCLGIFDVPVLRLRPKDHTLKVPHMGWNCLRLTQDEGLRVKAAIKREQSDACINYAEREQARCAASRVKDNGLFKGFEGGEYVYFVHSYYVPECPWTIATSDYSLPLSAALHRDNFYATQFHPEKSGKVGEQILKNFLEILN